jgi:hypothetical protein
MLLSNVSLFSGNLSIYSQKLIPDSASPCNSDSNQINVSMVVPCRAARVQGIGMDKVYNVSMVVPSRAARVQGIGMDKVYNISMIVPSRADRVQGIGMDKVYREWGLTEGAHRRMRV